MSSLRTDYYAPKAQLLCLEVWACHQAVHEKEKWSDQVRREILWNPSMLACCTVCHCYSAKYTLYSILTYIHPYSTSDLNFTIPRWRWPPGGTGTTSPPSFPTGTGWAWPGCSLAGCTVSGLSRHSRHLVQARRQGTLSYREGRHIHFINPLHGRLFIVSCLQMYKKNQEANNLIF